MPADVRYLGPFDRFEDMTDAAGPPEIDADGAAALRSARTVWRWGGGLLLAVAAMNVVTASGSTTGPVGTTLFWARTICFSVALVIFAVGVRGSGSVVGRRPVGVIALLALAAWPFVDQLVGVIAPPSMDNIPFYLVWGNVSLAVQLAAAVTAVTAIARAGVIRGRWRWAPLWALMATAAPQVILMLVASTPGTTSQDVLAPMIGLGQLVNIAVPLGLGILAIVLAQQRPLAVVTQVYPA